MRFTMLFFYVGLVAIIFGILGKFMLETYKLMNSVLFGDLEKIDLIIKVLEPIPIAAKRRTRPSDRRHPARGD